MNKIKRIKVQESIKSWNDKNFTKPKKTAEIIGESIGVNGRSITLWNKGKVPKQIQALSDIAKVLKVKFDDLFEIEYDPKTDTTRLTRIALNEAFEEHNTPDRRKHTFKTLSERTGYSELRFRLWNKGQLPFGILNFFNFCKEVKIRPSRTLEY